MTVEIWRDVAEFPGAYEVSNLGRVRSLPGGGRRARVLKGSRAGVLGNDYLAVCLTGKTFRKVHHLVALAFIGARPEGMNVCHNNGDRFDNRVDNLRYDTQSNNMLDCIQHGTDPRGALTHCKNGHEFTPENTRYTVQATSPTKALRRVCRTCSREHMRKKRSTVLV